MAYILMISGATEKVRLPTSDLKYDDVIKWKHFPRYWPFVRLQVNSPKNGQGRGALMFFYLCWINAWVNNREAGDLRRHRAHYDAILIYAIFYQKFPKIWELYITPI